MNRVKLTTTTTGTGDITVSTTPAARCRPLSSIAVGKMVRMLIEDESGTDWEVSDCIVTGATTFSRGKVWDGSAGPGNKTNFGAGTKTAAVVAILVDPVIPFNATIPLDRPEIAYMAPFTMTGPLTLTAGANPVDGAHVVATIIGDGTNDLAISGAVKHASSLPFNKTAGAKNIAQFLRTPGVTRYSISQAAADVVATAPAADTTGPIMNGAITSSSVGTTGYTLSWPAATDAVGVTGYEYSTNGGTSYTDVGNVLTVAVTGLTAATQYPNRVRAYDAAGNRSTVPLSLNVTTAAVADTIDPTMSGSLTTTNVGSSSYVMNWPAGSDNVAVTGYETSTDGGTTYSNAGNVLTRTITGASPSTLYNLRVRAYDAAGRRSAALSATVTTTAVVAANYETMIPTGSVFESGTSPKTYTGIDQSGPLNYEWGALWTKKLPAQTDGKVSFKVSNHVAQWLMLFMSNSSSTSYGSGGVGGVSAMNGAPYATMNTTQTSYNTITPANGDIIEMERIDSSGAAGNTATLKVRVSKNNGTSFQAAYDVPNFPNGELFIRWFIEGKPAGTPPVAITELQGTGLVA